MDSQPTNYIATDLDLYAKFDLEAFSKSLDDFGLQNLSRGHHEDGSYWGFRHDVHWANFEVCLRTLPAGRHNPEREVVAMLDLLESMPLPMRRIWKRCLRRRFNLGYQAGNDPFALHSRIAPKTLERMASLNIELEITIYQCDPPQHHEQCVRPPTTLQPYHR